MYQVALGLRSLAIKVVVFALLAGLFAWFLGGSIFPGSQVVNLPSFQWRTDNWHIQVAGNGRSPAPAHWRLIRVEPSGAEHNENFGLPGDWEALHGPVERSDGIIFGIERKFEGGTTWWTAMIDRQGITTTRQVASNADLFKAIGSSIP